jgi:hypothetical protein
MSAFVVSHDHIDALLTFADRRKMRGQLDYSEQLSWTQIGKILLAENERSVCHRYTDCVPGNCPGKIGEEAIGYKFRHMHELAMMQHTALCITIIKACDCFDYQACETDDYGQSIACRMIKSIRHEAVHSLPGYDDAPWEIDRDRLAKSLPQQHRRRLA